MMDTDKRKRLEAAGWRIGGVEEFLELSPAEVELIDLKLSLSQSVKPIRESQRLSQKDLAQRMGSSQSRIAKIEAGDSSVSLDLILRALFSAGATRQEIADLLISSQSNGHNSFGIV